MYRIFVLGGNNAEIAAIALLLRLAGERFIQPDKNPGAHKFSAEQLGLKTMISKSAMGDKEIPCIHECSTIIFVGCGATEEFPYCEKFIFIDQCSLELVTKAAILQVMDLLETRNSDATRRWAELVAAHNVGYIPAMMALGATTEEIQRVCAFDRKSRGISTAEEIEAMSAIASKKISGRLATLELAHSQFSTVRDRLYGLYDQLLIFSKKDEVRFYGDHDICEAVDKRFASMRSRFIRDEPGKWVGWNIKTPSFSVRDIKEFILQKLRAK